MRDPAYPWILVSAQFPPSSLPEQGKAESKLECESRDLIMAPFLWMQTSMTSWPTLGTTRSCCGSGRAGGTLWDARSAVPLSATCNSATRWRFSMVSAPHPTPEGPHSTWDLQALQHCRADRQQRGIWKWEALLREKVWLMSMGRMRVRKACINCPSVHLSVHV